MEFKPDPLAEAKSIVRAYAGGQQVGSESDTLDALTARAVAADPEKGARIKVFFDAVVKTRKVSAAEAKKLLTEIE
jgi:hypothetical protein